MAINAFTEYVMKLAEAGRRCPGGPVSPATIYRWSKRGIEGERLETINVGGVTMTSTEALQRFFERITAAKESKTQAALDALCDDVERSDGTSRRLEAAGLL
jgi:hypothetical protein